MRCLVLSVLVCCLLVQASLAQSDSSETNNPGIVPVGLFIGKIEEGARVFTPVRLLPFEHPDSEGHEFPNALQLHQQEYELLLYLGELVGLKLAATLQRYPKPPTSEWQYQQFDEIPSDTIKDASVYRSNDTPPIPGLSVVAFKDGAPIGFIVDTRSLSLEERDMERPTTMGLDLTRDEFLDGLTKAFGDSTARGDQIVVFDG